MTELLKNKPYWKDSCTTTTCWKHVLLSTLIHVFQFVQHIQAQQSKESSSRSQEVPDIGADVKPVKLKLKMFRELEDQGWHKKIK
jgi:hypothetical protein